MIEFLVGAAILFAVVMLCYLVGYLSIWRITTDMNLYSHRERLEAGFVYTFFIGCFVGLAWSIGSLILH